MPLPSRVQQYSSEKAERLEARLSRAQKELIQQAADLLNRSLTDFVVSCSQQIAEQVIRNHKIISLTTKESERFVRVLLNPPEPSSALKKAAKRYHSFIQDNT